MFKQNSPADASETLAVVRRRAAEATRKARIFNARNRIMGVDLKGLDQQVSEKRSREELEMRQEKAFDLLQMTQDALLVQQHKAEQDRRLELCQELQAFRALQQPARHSRNAHLHQATSILSFDVPQSKLGPASMQIFQGEDLQYKERRRAQMEACKKTLRAQEEEKERVRHQHRHMELLREKEQLQNDLRDVQRGALEQDSKRAVRTALDSYNRAQAEQHAKHQRKERLRAEEEEFMEIWHSVTSDLLTENPEAALRKLEETDRCKERKGMRGRVLVDRWKGMSAEQLSAIRKEQLEQRSEKERIRNTERQRGAVWHCLWRELEKKEEQEERRAREEEREKRIEMDRYNKQLAVEHSARQQHLKKQVHTNQPTAHYFAQFNSSSR